MRISDWSSDVCSSDLVRSQAMQLTIGKLAQAGDVGVETIRYYQRRGLLDTPARSGGDGWGGGIRRYGEDDQIGRASCRERVCQYGSISVVAVSLTTKTRT